MLGNLSAQTPKIYGIEDLHFADKTAVSLLQNLVQEAIQSPVILIVSSRYEPETVTENFWVQAEQNDQSYFNCIVGRVCGRISNAKFDLNSKEQFIKRLKK